MKAPSIVIATCEEWPNLSQSDALYGRALAKRGARVAAAPWRINGEINAAPFRDADAIILRAPWDYPHHIAEFLDWIAGIEARSQLLLNSPALVRWNSDKRYMLDLQRAGVRIPRTIALGPRAGADALREAIARVDQSGTGRAVMKPTFGGSGFGVALTSADKAEDHWRRGQAEAPGRSWLIQEFLPAIETRGELKFAFIAGAFAHAIRFTPAQGEFRTNSKFQPPPPERVEPSAALLADAQRVIAALPGGAPHYARIDGIEDDDGRFICLEAEAIDPALSMQLAPETADKFADATLAAIHPR